MSAERAMDAGELSIVRISNPTQRAAVLEVLAERRRQDQTWGADQFTNSSRRHVLAVLVEEVGEVAKALNDNVGSKPSDAIHPREPDHDLICEYTHVAAVAIAAIEAELARGYRS